MRTNDEFTNWLIEQLEERDWSQANLARRAEISPAQVSNVLSGERQPGLDFLQGIARAFRIPLEDVFRYVGVLPPMDSDDPTIAGLIGRLGSLPADQRQNIVEHVHDLLDLILPVLSAVDDDEDLDVEDNRFAGTKFEDRPPADREELIEFLDLLETEELKQYYEAISFIFSEREEDQDSPAEPRIH